MTTLQKASFYFPFLSREYVVNAVDAEGQIKDDEVDEFVGFGFLELFELRVIGSRQLRSTRRTFFVLLSKKGHISSHRVNQSPLKRATWLLATFDRLF